MPECSICGATLPEFRRPSNWRQALWGGWTCPHCRHEFDRFGRHLGIAGQPRRTETLDDSTPASDPGGFTLSHTKLRILRPDLYRFPRTLLERLRLIFPQSLYLREQLQNGDTRAALVVSTNPLLVAAYTDELDCVAILQFPGRFVDDYQLRERLRLITVNLYRRSEQYDDDLMPGPNETRRWSGYHPVIADFLTDDIDKLERRKREITEDEWQRATEMGYAYLRERPGVVRDGRPVYAGEAAH